MREFLLSLLAVLGVLCHGGTAVACAPPSDPVATQQGLARGVTANGVTSYRGIEYARAERWKAPGPGPRWEGERLFDHYGRRAPQTTEGTLDEHCLFLNVWTPADTEPAAGLPVLVWIHGGGFRGGSGEMKPEAIVRRNVIVVSFNYRLGKLGFFDHASWDASAPRNFGMLDMVAALRWVQDNVGAFGGDPERVTIAGNSAGGMGVQLMMVAEGARGLFASAIAQAGYGAWPFPKASCVPGVAPSADAIRPMDELRNTSAAALVSEVTAFWLPFTGSAELPDQPAALFAEGKIAAVPYLCGANSYDGQHTMQGAGFTVEGLFALLGDQADAAKKLYASDMAVSEAQAAQRLFGDLRYVRSSRMTARAMEAIGEPGYLYYYDAPAPGLPGAPHGSEFGEVFAAQGSPIQSYWLNFVRSGTPNGPDLPEWKPFTAESPNWMVFRAEPELSSGVLSEKLDFLESLR